MKFPRVFLSTFCILFSLSFVQAQEIYSKVKIHAPSDRPARSALIGLLQIDHFDTDQDGGIITEIGETDLKNLKGTSYSYEILVPDVSKYLDSVNQIYYASLNKKKNSFLGRVAIEQPGSLIDRMITTPAVFEVKKTFGGYYTFTEMEAAMNTLVASYPAIAQKISIGKTYNNKDIWVIKISDNVATDESNEPEILYMGLQHPREAITGASMIFFMQYLCEQYAIDNRIRDLVNSREFFIIPCFNPDGYEYNYTSKAGAAGGSWRKNRRLISGTTYGVDLNRNWGVDWGNCPGNMNDANNSCGTKVASAQTYIGPSAFSEKETQALRDFVKKQHIVVGFDQHAFGPYYSLPFGRQALHTMSQKGKDFFTAIPALMGKYNGMRAADSYDALGYEVAGGFKDWMLMGDLGTSIGTGKKDTVWAMTGEGGAAGGTSAFGSMANFWAPAAEIINLCKGMVYQNLQLAFAAGTYVDIQDVSDMAMNSKTGNLSFRIKRLGLGNDPVKVSLVPLENMIVGGSVTVNSMTYYEDYNGEISYSLPAAIGNGQRVKFAWKVETGGYSYSDTIIKLYNPQSLVYDDMEGLSASTNWTITGGGWNYSAESKIDGLKSLTESPGGIYSAGVTRIATNKISLNLTNASAAYLTFWTKYRAENFRDKLQVQVSTNSTDGSNGTWTAIAGKHTIQEPGTLDGSTIDGKPSLTGIQDYWVQEIFDFTPYNNSSNVRFRLVFTSDNVSSTFKYNQDEGFYIDNLKVVKTNANLVVLPAEFLSFSGKLLPDYKVHLNWEANIDAEHDYFEVQRSSNGYDFVSITKINSLPPYWFLDKTPKSGNNFYRIKQVDKDGTVTYSKIINVYIESAIKLTVYPNPVNDQLVISIGSRNAQSYKIQVTDIQGKVVYDVMKKINSSTTEININVRSWKPQLYILRIIGANNEVVETQKIIKL